MQKQRMSRFHRLLWLAALAGVALGGGLCLLTGRTMAHVLSIAMAALFMASAVHLADAYLPDSGTPRVRRGSAALFAGAFLALMAFYLWHIRTAQTVFIFDNSLYYYQQLDLANRMNEGLLPTLRHVWESLSTDYTSVPNLLMAPLFSLTDRTSAGFGLATAVMVWAPLMYQLRRVSLRLAQRLQLTDGGTFLLCAGACVSVCCLPLLHRAALWRQINLLGMPLLVQVVYLSWNADFRKPEPLRLTALFLSALMLALMRRWFLFFLAGYLLLWGLLTALRLIQGRAWHALRNLALYGIACAMLAAVLLWPLLTHAIQGNYTEAYAYWNKAGLSYEIWNQSWLVGWGSCGLIAAGYLWGIMQKRSADVRRLAGVMLAGGAVTLFLFTRIQNMTFHQSTILMPAYVLGLLLFFAMLASLRRQWLRRGATLLTAALLMLQWGMSVTHEEPQTVSPLLSHTSLKPPVRRDMAALEEICAFVRDHCDADHQALFLCNSADYDRLTFVNLSYPDMSLREKVSLQRIALPSDGFPWVWFSAEYLIVPTQVQTNQPGGTVEKLTHFVLNDFADRFEVVHRVAFDGFDMLILRRKGPVQPDEPEALQALFAAESERYPVVFHDRIRWFYEQEIREK